MQFKTIYSAALVCAAAMIAAIPAWGQMAQTLFGYDVTVLKGYPDKLFIGGDVVLQDGRIDILEITLAGDLPVAIGWTGPGGNNCGSVPFVVSFDGDVPQLDVSPLECFGLEREVGDREIKFFVPIEGGQTFLWRPETGFIETTQAVSAPVK